ncbi:MAG: DUF4157 domain-containing protein [Bacteroidota bacterium]|nr:DUF4157 domain-containing protein [Bacteroidota bacterium]
MGSLKIKSIADYDLSNTRIRENSWIAKLAAKKLRSYSVAIVLGETIHLYNVSRPQFLSDEKWVKHEICHLEQFKKYGYLSFIAKYLWESILHGYSKNKYETEARNAEIN